MTVNMKIALYARVSTKDKGQDTENQLQQLRDFCQRQGWNIAHEYVDHLSGKNGDRPEFKKMFDAASRKEFDCLLFLSLDRLSREGVFKTLQYLQQLTAYGVNWRSYTEQYLDSTGFFRDAVIGILAAVAQQERIRISERTIAGLDRARRQGQQLGRPKADINILKARKLRAEGLSFGEISRRLDCSRDTLIRHLRKIADNGRHQTRSKPVQPFLPLHLPSARLA
jgi:DNA invertase Pin-like site-specific DNA recombinase